MHLGKQNNTAEQERIARESEYLGAKLGAYVVSFFVASYAVCFASGGMTEDQGLPREAGTVAMTHRAPLVDQLNAASRKREAAFFSSLSVSHEYRHYTLANRNVGIIEATYEKNNERITYDFVDKIVTVNGENAVIPFTLYDQDRLVEVAKIGLGIIAKSPELLDNDWASASKKLLGDFVTSKAKIETAPGPEPVQ